MRIACPFTCRSWFSFIAFMSLIALTLAACDSGGGNGGNGGEGESFPEPPGRPGFVSTVQGDWQASLSGSAVYERPIQSREGASVFAIRLSDAGADTPVITLTGHTVLQPGRYAIRPAGQDRIVAHIQDPDTENRWTGLSGQLQIDEHSGTSIVGRFRIVADSERGASITASGAFVTTLAGRQ